VIYPCVTFTLRYEGIRHKSVGQCKTPEHHHHQLAAYAAAGALDPKALIFHLKFFKGPTAFSSQATALVAVGLQEGHRGRAGLAVANLGSWEWCVLPYSPCFLSSVASLEVREHPAKCCGNSSHAVTSEEIPSWACRCGRTLPAFKAGEEHVCWHVTNQMLQIKGN